jgi:hypothetical protein
MHSNRLFRTDYTPWLHPSGVDWSKDDIFTYVDGRLQQVLFIDFKGDPNLWQRGYIA